MERDLKKEYEDMINTNKIFVFMKGTPEEPMCGFSYRVINILMELEQEFNAYNILEDPELREAIKEFSNWPTYPQVYLNGELLGGCEIIEQIFRDGDLIDILEE